MNDARYAYLSLGSNSNDAPAMLDRAVAAIRTLPDAQVLDISPVYFTEPQDFSDQPWFHNLAMKIAAAPCWTPQNLLTALLDLEKSLGRKRSKDQARRFGPRVIDIDLLLFGHETLCDPACTLPHPRMARRAFVLVPLRDIEPSLKIYGKPLEELLAAFEWRLEGRTIFQ